MASWFVLPIEKTSLEFVVNTNWDLFFDKSDSKYYLLDEKRWLTAAALEGPWTATTKLPKDMSKIPDQPNWAGVKKAIPPPSGATGAAPKVFYSNTPAEIITFKGQPAYAKIPNTQLSYATNYGERCFSSGWGEPILLPDSGAMVPREEPRWAVDFCYAGSASGLRQDSCQKSARACAGFSAGNRRSQ